MIKVVNIREEKCDIYCGRGSKYGNPYKIGKDGDRETVLWKYQTWIQSRPELLLNFTTWNLIEWNNWGDTFWGKDIRSKKGYNYLGRLLTNIRDGK